MILHTLEILTEQMAMLHPRQTLKNCESHWMSPLIFNQFVDKMLSSQFTCGNFKNVRETKKRFLCISFRDNLRRQKWTVQNKGNEKKKRSDVKKIQQCYVRPSWIFHRKLKYFHETLLEKADICYLESPRATKICSRWGCSSYMTVKE